MLDHLYEHPSTYSGCMLLLVLGFDTVACLLAFYIKRLLNLYSAFPSPVVRYTLCVALAPVVFSVAKLIAVIAPKWWAWAFVISAFYESATLVAMLRLVTVYLGGPGQDLEVLGSGPVQKVWAVQPFCCCWLPCYVCMAKRHFGSSDMIIVSALVYQRAFLAPLLAIVAATERSSGGAAAGASLGRSRLEVFSLVVAIFAFGVLVRAAEHSHELHTGKLRDKIISLSTVLIANMCIFHLTVIGVIAARMPGEESPAGCQIFPTGCYSPVDVLAARSSGATSIALVPLALFLRQAFPLVEVGNISQETADAVATGVSVADTRRRRFLRTDNSGEAADAADAGAKAGGDEEEELGARGFEPSPQSNRSVGGGGGGRGGRGGGGLDMGSDGRGRGQAVSQEPADDADEAELEGVE